MRSPTDLACGLDHTSAAGPGRKRKFCLVTACRACRSRSDDGPRAERPSNKRDEFKNWRLGGRCRPTTLRSRRDRRCLWVCSCRRYQCCSLVKHPSDCRWRNRIRREEVVVVLRICRSIAVVLAVLARGAVQRREPGVGVRLWCLRSRRPRLLGRRRARADRLGRRTEDILMSLSVTGSSDRAAWVMPVPSAARVSLGDTEVFEDLGRLTAPRIEYRDSWWPTIPWLVWAGAAPDTAGAPAGAVNVLGRQRLGPFDVTRLAADDPTALANWLKRQRISTSRWAGRQPRTVCRRRLGDRRDSTGARRSGRLIVGSASAAAPLVRL